MKTIPTLLKNYKRVSNHKKYIYDRIIELHNNISRRIFSMDLETQVEVVRKKTTRTKKQSQSYYICKLSKDDLDLLNDCKKELALARKYKRRLKLLDL